MYPLLPKKSTASTGYMVFCIVITGLFALAYEEAMFIIFTVFLLLIFIIGASIDAGKPEKDLELVGWSGRNMELVIPLGIAGGMFSFLIGAVIMRNVEPSSIYQAFIIDLSTTGTVFPKLMAMLGLTTIASASIIPSVLSTSANILGQWFTVAPSEEALSKIIVPWASLATFKNWVLAYIIGTLFWIIYHIPKFVTQSVDGRMYIVLLLIAAVNVALVIFTKNVLAGVISHATFNTDVIIYPGVNQTAFYVILIIMTVLVFIWFWSKKAKTARRAS